jgi:hypothetical protein
MKHAKSRKARDVPGLSKACSRPCRRSCECNGAAFRALHVSCSRQGAARKSRGPFQRAPVMWRAILERLAAKRVGRRRAEKACPPRKKGPQRGAAGRGYGKLKRGLEVAAHAKGEVTPHHVFASRDADATRVAARSDKIRRNGVEGVSHVHIHLHRGAVV